jgi:hypothetical protein
MRIARELHPSANSVGTRLFVFPQSENMTSGDACRSVLIAACAEKVYTPYDCRAGREDAGRSKPHRIAQPPSFPAWRRAIL